MNINDTGMSPNAERQLRGLILRLVFVNHNAQAARLNSTLITAVLDREGYRFSADEVLTMLQDMRDRAYIRYVSNRDPIRRRMYIFEIELTARGRDLMSGLTDDPAVQVD